MNKTKNALTALRRKQAGLTTVEYAVAGGLISAVVIAAFTALGGKVSLVIQWLADNIPTP
jgi:pilus assembly protein Flp/PilA